MSLDLLHAESVTSDFLFCVFPPSRVPSSHTLSMAKSVWVWVWVYTLYSASAVAEDSGGKRQSRDPESVAGRRYETARPQLFFPWTTRWSGCTNRRSLSEKRKVITSSCKIFRSAKCAFSAVLVVTIYIFTVCRRQLRLPRVNMLWYCDSFNRHFSSSIIFTKHVDRSVNARLIFWILTAIGNCERLPASAKIDWYRDVKVWADANMQAKSLHGIACAVKHMFWKNRLLCKKHYAENICSEKNMTDVFTKQLFKSGSATGHISMTLDSAKPSPVFRVGVRQGYGLVWEPLSPALSFWGSVEIVQIFMLVIFELFKMSK